MTNQTSAVALTESAVRVPSRHEAFRAAMEFFSTHPKQMFTVFQGLEYMPDEELRALNTYGSTLAPLTEELRRVGVDVKGTVGELLDLKVLTKLDAHAVACDCDIGVKVVDGALAKVLFSACLARPD